MIADGRIGFCAKSANIVKSRGLVRHGDRLSAVTAFQFVSANQAMHGVATICRVLGVSTSGYYAWRTRPRSERARTDAELSLRIQAIHENSRATYGAPRIHAELADEGIRVGCKRVARLMEVAGIYGVSRRRRIATTTRDRAARPAPDLVNGTSARQPPMSCGCPTSLTFPPGRAFYIWPGARRVQPQSGRVGDGNSSAHGAGVSGAQYGDRADFDTLKRPTAML